MRTLILFFSALVAISTAFKTNRTSCFQYISCLESIQSNLKDCVGGTAISLTLEAKDVNIRDLVKYRALEFVGCQDRLLKEIVDFEALQVLVNEDANECFEKLPESSKRIEPFTDSCDYVQPMLRNTTRRDSLQCLIEYKQDREYCESLLECCPDHTRCGERMNAVSLSYQNARVKAEQIVYNMISCIVSNDPRFLREGARLQALRDPYRNAGVPFLRPDAYTEARITRRLALTSTSTLAQRRERFLKKYTQVRQVVAQKLVNQYTTTTIAPFVAPVEDVVAEVSETVEKVEEKKEVVKEKEAETETETSETAETDETKQSEDTEQNSEERVQTVRNLIRTASDKDLSTYVALISEGKFTQLFELAEKKEKNNKNMSPKLTAKMGKLKEIITKALTEKSSEQDQLPDDAKTIVVRSSDKDEVKTDEKKASEKKEIKEELVVMEEEKKTTEEPSPALFTISDSVETTSKPVQKAKNLMAESHLVHTVIEKPIRTTEVVGEIAPEKVVEEKVVEEKEETTSDVKVARSISEVNAPPTKKTEDAEPDNEPEAKEITEKNRAMLVEMEIKDGAEKSKKTVTEEKKTEKEEEALIVDDAVVLETDSAEKKDAMESLVQTLKESIETSTPVAEELITTTLKSELLSNLDEVLTLKPVVENDAEDIEGSGEETTALPSSTTTVTLLNASPDTVIEKVKLIRPRTEQSHCQQYASCWQTLIDYEQQCDRKYSTEVLSHGIDDSEILSILHNSSISHHEIVLKACLRPLDKSVHSTLKQLLVIQRGVRKACLDLGRNKIAVTDAEESQCNSEIPTSASIDEYLSSEHVRSQANHLTCRAKLEPIREACTIVRNCCASVETCDNYIASSPVKKLETEAVRRLVKRQNDCETKMLQTLTYIHEQLSSPTRRRRFYYH